MDSHAAQVGNHRLQVLSNFAVTMVPCFLSLIMLLTLCIPANRLLQGYLLALAEEPCMQLSE